MSETVPVIDFASLFDEKERGKEVRTEETRRDHRPRRGKGYTYRRDSE